MGSKTPEILHSFHNLFLAVLIILAVLFLLCLIRAVIGPRVADRIMAINMMFYQCKLRYRLSDVFIFVFQSIQRFFSP